MRARFLENNEISSRNPLILHPLTYIFLFENHISLVVIVKHQTNYRLWIIISTIYIKSDPMKFYQTPNVKNIV